MKQKILPTIGIKQTWCVFYVRNRSDLSASKLHRPSSASLWTLGVVWIS